MSPIVRLPQEKQQKVKALEAAKKELLKTGSQPRAETLAEKLGWTIEDVHWVENLSPTLVPADSDRRDREYGRRPRGAILIGDEPNPESAYMRKELAEVIQMCLELLSRKARVVFVARVLEQMKMKDVAKTFNCSLEAVRQWQKQAQLKMQTCLEQHGWSLEG